MLASLLSRRRASRSPLPPATKGTKKRTGREGKSCAAGPSNGASAKASATISARTRTARIALSPGERTRSCARRGRRDRRRRVAAQAEHQPAVTFDAVGNAQGAERLPVVGVRARHDRDAEFVFDQRRGIGTGPLIAGDIDAVRRRG